MCAPDIDTEATQQLAWRVPRDVAVLFFAVGETLRSRLWTKRGRWLTDGELFDALLDCALLAWTLRDPRARPPDPVIEREAIAARCRAARRGGTCMTTTLGSAPPAAPMRRAIASRSAPSTTSAACTRGCCG